MAAIGERLKMARQRAGLSLRELAERVGVSAQAISKYERGLDVPGSGVLLRLSKALDVRVDYFFRPESTIALQPAYRCRADLGRKRERAILGKIQEWLERYLDVESLLDVQPCFDLLGDLERQVRCVEDAERVATGLRAAWALGSDPIESLVETLEEHGVKVGLVDGDTAFDACTFMADEGMPVIAVNSTAPGDRQRFSLAHELGHLVMILQGDVDAEQAANRFAGALLIPAPALRKELGERRRTLSLYELAALKRKYGVSMQALIHRAQDLGILAASGATALYRRFASAGWRKKEPAEGVPQEKPTRMERLIMRALAEDCISASRASELLGEPLSGFLQREVQDDRALGSVHH